MSFLIIIFSRLRFFQYFKIEVINIMYGLNILPFQCKFEYLLIKSTLINIMIIIKCLVKKAFIYEYNTLE